MECGDYLYILGIRKKENKKQKKLEKKHKKLVGNCRKVATEVISSANKPGTVFSKFKKP